MPLPSEPSPYDLMFLSLTNSTIMPGSRSAGNFWLILIGRQIRSANKIKANSVNLFRQFDPVSQTYGFFRAGKIAKRTRRPDDHRDTFRRPQRGSRLSPALLERIVRSSIDRPPAFPRR